MHLQGNYAIIGEKQRLLSLYSAGETVRDSPAFLPRIRVAGKRGGLNVEWLELEESRRKNEKGKRKNMKYIKDILKGIIIGIANIIPGVSGGTMAVSMGIYDVIIGSITGMFKSVKSFKKSLLTLLPYGIGMVLAILGLASVIELLFDKFPFPTAMLFIGLIFGGLPAILSKVKGKKVTPVNILLFLVFFGLIIGMQFLKSGTDTVLTVSVGEVIRLFLIGVLASATMVIPGVSGSMMLMVLGYYNPILSEINEFVHALVGLDMTGLLHGVGILLPFGIGVIVGIIVIAKIIEVLLRKFECQTYYAILGLVVSSPFAVLMGIGVGALGAGVIVAGIVTFAAGFAAAYLLGRMK